MVCCINKVDSTLRIFLCLLVHVGCVDNICSSDHKPVFASFDIGVVTQFTSSHGGSILTADMKIVFEDISVEVSDQHLC